MVGRLPCSDLEVWVTRYVLCALLHSFMCELPCFFSDFCLKRALCLVLLALCPAFCVCVCKSSYGIYINAYRVFPSCSLFAIDMKGNVEANRYMKRSSQNVPIFSLFVCGSVIYWLRFNKYKSDLSDSVV